MSIILPISLIIYVIDMRIGRFINKLLIYRSMARTRGETTKLVAAKTKTDSLRATVPSFIVKSLHLEAGDELEWGIESFEHGVVKVVIVRAEKAKGGAL